MSWAAPELVGALKLVDGPTQDEESAIVVERRSFRKVTCVQAI